ncbi:MAG: hypothetical protein QOD39_2896, partial [Mycobacterium sp.]|nr:hypothetical protein [Mycobacterium sp.]
MFLLRGQARDVSRELTLATPVRVAAMRRLDRRWWIAIGVAVVAVMAVVLSYTVFGKTPEECRPVQDMFDFNKSQAALIESKAGDS